MILGCDHSGESAFTHGSRIIYQVNKSDSGQAGMTIRVDQFIFKMLVVFYV